MSTPSSDLRSLMPEHIRKQWDEQDAHKAKLTAQMQRECADALASIADALRFPNIARADLEIAQKHVMRALSIAAAIDPEEVP